MNLLTEFKRLVTFLFAHLPSLHKSIRISHSLTWKQVLLWALLLELLIGISMILSSFAWYGGLSGIGYLLNSIFAISMIRIFGLAAFTGLLGIGLQNSQDSPFHWNSWLETVFLCLIPMYLIELVLVWIQLNGLVVKVIYFGIFCYSVFLLSQAVRFKFGFTPIHDTKKRNLFYVVVAISAVILFQAIHSPLRLPGGWTANNDYLMENGFPEGNASADTEFSGPLPKSYEKQVLVLYKKDKLKQKAALQYARAVWGVLSPGEQFDEANEELMRSSSCIAERDMEIDEMRIIKSIVLEDPLATKLFFENDAKFSGTVSALGEYEPSACYP